MSTQSSDLLKTTPSPDAILTLELVLDRLLDRIEARMKGPQTEPAPPADTALALPPKETEKVQFQVSDARQLDAMVGARVDDLRVRMQAEIKGMVEDALRPFKGSVDSKVMIRISALEKALNDQSAIVATLSQRTNESDVNFQRLISLLERMCDRQGTSTAPPVRARSQRELNRSFAKPSPVEPTPRLPEPPVPVHESGFRLSFDKQDNRRPRHRKPLARL